MKAFIFEMLTAESELQVRQGNLYNPSHYFILTFNIRRAVEYMPISDSCRFVPFIAGAICVPLFTEGLWCNFMKKLCLPKIILQKGN